MTNTHDTTTAAADTTAVNADMDAELTDLIRECIDILKNGASSEQVAGFLGDKAEAISEKYGQPLPVPDADPNA